MNRPVSMVRTENSDLSLTSYVATFRPEDMAKAVKRIKRSFRGLLVRGRCARIDLMDREVEISPWSLVEGAETFLYGDSVEGLSGSFSIICCADQHTVSVNVPFYLDLNYTDPKSSEHDWIEAVPLMSWLIKEVIS